jgi:methylated-DNA-[protein]-cysteine S-methyltransferase
MTNGRNAMTGDGGNGTAEVEGIARAVREEARGSERALAERSRWPARRTEEAAWDGGHADVAFGHAESPFGPIFVALTRRGLVRVAFPGGDLEQRLAWLARDTSPRIVESARATEATRRQIEEYFEGRRRNFDLPLDLEEVRGFRREVLEATVGIPYGSISTYREIARRAGRPAATRAAGSALGSNPVPIVIPCHRVLRTGGGLGGYGWGLERKADLLRLEGALVA